MLSPARTLTDVAVLLVTAIQGSTVYAQSQGDDNPYYYWFSPGRIAGLAVGAVALILLIVVTLVLACRRCRRAKATNVIVPNYPHGNGHPQAYPSWQHVQQPSYLPPATESRWYHPVPPTARFDRVKNALPPRRPAPSQPMPHAAPVGQGQGAPSFDDVQRPAPLGHAQNIAFPGQAQQITPPGQVGSTAPPGQAQTSMPSSQAQSTSTVPSGRPQSTTPSVRQQEQGALPPRYPRTRDAQVSTTSGRDPSPPPYSPPTGPPPSPPPTHVAH